MNESVKDLIDRVKAQRQVKVSWEEAEHSTLMCLIEALSAKVDALSRSAETLTKGILLGTQPANDVQDECARATAFIDAVRALIRSSDNYSVEKSTVGAKELKTLKGAFLNYKKEKP